MLVKKQCVVVTSFDKNQPGYLDFSYRIKALNNHYQLTIVSHRTLSQEEMQFPIAQYHVIQQGQGKLGWLMYCWKCADYIRKQKPSVVVLLHSGLSPIALLLSKVPTVLYWNEHPTNLVHLPAKRYFHRYLLSIIAQKLIFRGARHADLVMPIGEELRNELIEMGCESTQVEMIYMGVADTFAASQKTNAVTHGWLRLIYIGTVSQQRGRDVMLEAMTILAKKKIPVHLTIVGAWLDELTYCERKVQELGISSQVSVFGRVGGSQIPKFLAASDMGLCLWEDKPWWRFNPPTKLFEYLVAGLPVVASNIRTHTRYIQDWHNGLIFEYDANSLAEAIVELVRNQHMLVTLKKNAANSGKSYLWSCIEQQFISAISRLNTA